MPLPHVELTGIDPYRVVYDAVEDGVGDGVAAETAVCHSLVANWVTNAVLALPWRGFMSSSGNRLNRSPGLSTSHAQGHDGPFVEALERVERSGRVHPAWFAFGPGIDDHRAHLPMFA